MTTVITRLYSDAKTAKAVLSDLKSAGFKDDMVDLIGSGSDAAATMETARVPNDAAAKYADHMGKGALVVARVPLMPQGAAYAAMDIVDAHSSVNAGVANQNAYIREQADYARFKSHMTNHNHIIGHDLQPGYSEKYGLVTAAFGLKHLKPHRTKRSAIAGGAFKSRMFWPMPLLKKKDGSNSAISGGRHMSKAFWPMPLISRRPASAKVS